MKQTKYYDPKFMQVFDNIEDIDIDFIKDSIVPDYHYNNEWSPINMIKRIESILDEQEGL